MEREGRRGVCECAAQGAVQTWEGVFGGRALRAGAGATAEGRSPVSAATPLPRAPTLLPHTAPTQIKGASIRGRPLGIDILDRASWGVGWEGKRSAGVSCAFCWPPPSSSAPSLTQLFVLHQG